MLKYTVFSDKILTDLHREDKKSRRKMADGKTENEGGFFSESGWILATW